MIKLNKDIAPETTIGIKDTNDLLDICFRDEHFKIYKVWTYLCHIFKISFFYTKFIFCAYYLLNTFLLVCQTSRYLIWRAHRHDIITHHLLKMDRLQLRYLAYEVSMGFLLYYQMDGVRSMKVISMSCRHCNSMSEYKFCNDLVMIFYK